MDLLNTFKPIPVICDYWYTLCSLKEFSSSTIIFHQKKQHPDLPFNYNPTQIQCEKCMAAVPITGISLHYSTCEKKEKKALEMVIEEIAGTVRAICRFCKRKFTIGRIEKHQSACENASKKRPLFNIIKKRIPFLEESIKKPSTKRNSVKLKYPNSKWQKQHMQMIKNLRYEEEESVYEDYQTCPHCSRKFAPAAAEKHFEICKNILNKPKPPPSIVSQRFPSLRKLDQPLSIRTNSMKTLWRPCSVIKKSILDKSNASNVLTTSIDDLPASSIPMDTVLSPIKMPPLKQDLSLTRIDQPVNDPMHIKFQKKILLVDTKRKLRPSATVKNIEGGQENIKYVGSKIELKKIWSKNRSNSTQRVGESPLYCHMCGANFPSIARFCMMCGIIKI